MPSGHISWFTIQAILAYDAKADPKTDPTPISMLTPVLEIGIDEEEREKML